MVLCLATLAFGVYKFLVSVKSFAKMSGKVRDSAAIGLFVLVGNWNGACSE